MFVDNSNLWITGKKVAARAQKFAAEVKDDPRWRIDYGKLLDCIRLEPGTPRELSFAKLYGSDEALSPSVAAVRKAAVEKGFGVEFFAKSAAGHEKEVDVQLAVDATVRITTEKSHAKDIIVIVAGDRDFAPVIRAAAHFKWASEVWSFKDSRSGVYDELAAKLGPGVLRLHDLDDHVLPTPPSPRAFGFFRFSLLKEDSPLTAGGMRRDAVSPHTSLFVRTTDAHARRVAVAHGEALASAFSRLAAWPINVDWAPDSPNWRVGSWLFELTCSGTDKSPTSPAAAALTALLSQLRPPTALATVAAEVGVTVALVGPSITLEVTAPAPPSGRCLVAPEFADDGGGGGGGGRGAGGSSGGDGKLEIVGGPRVCNFALNCKFGLDCMLAHTDVHKGYFEHLKRSRRGCVNGANPRRKTTMCSAGVTCRKWVSGGKRPESTSCDYFHDKAVDAWCMSCCRYGHLAEECPKFHRS